MAAKSKGSSSSSRKKRKSGAGSSFNGAGPGAFPEDAIIIQGAREHNLKNLSTYIPRGQFVVVTGVSGSGKSTLAFDLIFAEGQRRFLDSMSAYARQFVEQMSRPDVDLITGIPPTVSIEQRNSRGGGKSTVATVTEIFHFFRLLYCKLGTQYCPNCQIPVQPQTRDQLTERLLEELKSEKQLSLLAPVIRNRKGFHSEVADWAAQEGFEKIRADGRWFDPNQPFKLDRFKEHDVEILIAESSWSEVESGPKYMQELRQHIDTALRVGKGSLYALNKKGKQWVYSTERACSSCGESFAELEPKMFSYNSPRGWCPTCRGFGEIFDIPDVDRGARADSVEESWFRWREGEREVCPDCEGNRLNKTVRAVRLDCGNAAELGALLKPEAGYAPTMDFFVDCSVESVQGFFDEWKVTGRDRDIARDILPEISERLKFLREVGLGYLQLGRSATTLSGGEAQRIRLAAQLGSNLSGALYILDEPSIGLHARDNDQLLGALTALRDRGNSVIVVEHDDETMRRADYILDLGPGAGVHGGTVVAAGTYEEILKQEQSLTGSFLRKQPDYPTRGERRPVTPLKSWRDWNQEESPWLVLRHASVNNLKDLTLTLPQQRFVVVTGVSGAGKSTLIQECLGPAVSECLERRKSRDPILENGMQVSSGMEIYGADYLTSVCEVDQSPIGRTPRSTPATYVGFFDTIRKTFAQLPESKLRGYSPGRFSFNSKEGRCPNCEGAGQIKLEMNFLPPAFVTCELCGGKRFNPETLDVEYNGKNIAEILDLSVEEAAEFFDATPSVKRALEALKDTGLDYVRLGQTSPTLSGGEAQRVRLVTHLLSGLKPGLARARFNGGQRKLFILEEPTIGLHMSDVQRLVDAMNRLVDAGHTVVVIEHNLDLIAEADWVIDMGPEGGQAGGEIIAEGTPEDLVAIPHSHTGRYLAPLLNAQTGSTENAGPAQKKKRSTRKKTQK